MFGLMFALCHLQKY